MNDRQTTAFVVAIALAFLLWANNRRAADGQTTVLEQILAAVFGRPIPGAVNPGQSVTGHAEGKVLDLLKPNPATVPGVDPGAVGPLKDYKQPSGSLPALHNVIPTSFISTPIDGLTVGDWIAGAA